ncbi:CinA family protein [Sphingomonas endolithica]|uniref:CinA family protein n=1 Tax=Sphingomonas endolithica TaxID=2972485 RepID=UPI0021AE9816|nr:CinA family protein [Sphingomonas sp. ZFBP2030]
MVETLSPVLSERVERLTETLLQEANDAGLMLATAESCTGGLLASLLTDVDGGGHVFDRGFVVYSEHAKCELLGLAQQQIDCCGAVSRDVAVAMAEGALAASDAQVALAITGFAGPGAPGDEPGLVHFACAREGRDIAHREEHFGDIGRGGVRQACLEVALEMMVAAVR